MKTIVIDAREFNTSSGRYVAKLINYLQEIDKDNNYKVLLKPLDAQTWQPSNKRFQEVSCTYKEFSYSEQLGLNRQIISLNPDLVHFTFPQQPVLYGGKTITTIHDLTTLRFTNPDKNIVSFKLKQKIYSRVIKKVVSKSDYVIVPSKFVKDDLITFSGINPDKIKIIYEAADPIEDSPKPIESVYGKNFIMYVGRPTPHKNLEKLIEAFVLLKKKHPELYLVLAGKEDGNYGRVRDKVEKLSIKDIIFTGFVSEGQLRWLYENCQAYIFPSLSEGFGLPGLEAMAHGAPVISSNATCLPEIYGDAAHYFDPNNVKQMASSIDDVLSNDKLKDDLIKKGRVQVKKYSWHKMAQETLSIYNKVLGL